MRVPSHQSPATTSFQAKTSEAPRLFRDSPDSSFPAEVRDSYHSSPSQGKLLSETLTRNRKQYEQLLQKAVQAGKISSEQSESKLQDFEKGKLGPYGAPSQDKELRALENDQFLLMRYPQQCADGLYRTQDYYQAPGTMHLNAVARGWETSTDENGQEIPVADALVVGAGPGGLTTAWQLARRGGRVVVFESEIAGAAFSDAGAKAVHSMRTSADGTNLVQEGHALATLEHPLSMHGNLPQYRQLAKAGRQAEAQATGQASHGVPRESQSIENRNAPAARGELFEHLAQLSHSLANDFPDAFLSERSPVSGVSYQDGLFTVTTSRGHKMKAKQLVLATGLTGPQGEKARLLPQFSDLEKQNLGGLVSLGSESDVLSEAEELTALAKGESRKPLLVHDRLLGQLPVRQTIARFEPGSRVAVVGSGESAVKAALELVHLNPGISVDLFAKEKMEAAQTQLPNENFHTAVLENTLQDTGAIESARGRAELFGTPVTPRSLQEMLELQNEGRLRLLEMGAYFDPSTVEAKLSEGELKLQVKSDSVATKLTESHRTLTQKGLMPEGSEPYQGGNYRALVQAVGYRKQSLQDHPLRHLPPEAHQKMYLNTAGQPNHPAETSLAGLSVRGRQLAEQLAEVVPSERKVEITVPEDRGIDWRDVDAETVQGIIESRGLHPGFVRAVRRDIEEFGSHPDESRLLLPSSDDKLRELHYKREKGTISPAELEVLERALTLAQRMSSQ